MRYIPSFGPFADFGEALVHAVLPDELLMRAALGNFSIFHNENLVGLLDGGQAVGNRDDRLAARKLRNGLLDEVLVFGVDARGRLIEDDNGCVFDSCFHLH